MRFSTRSLRRFAFLAAIASAGAASQVAYAGGLVRTMPTESSPPAEQPSRLSQDLREVVGSLRGMTPAQRYRLTQARRAHAAPPIAYTSGWRQNMLEVYIDFERPSRETLERLTRIGFIHQLGSTEGTRLQGYLPLDRIEDAAALPNISLISRPIYSVANAGLITTEGDDAMNTVDIRGGQYPADGSETGPTGEGVVVGVLSVGLFDRQWDVYRGGSIDTNLLAGNLDPRVTSGDIPAGAFANTSKWGDVTTYPTFSADASRLERDHAIPTLTFPYPSSLPEEAYAPDRGDVLLPYPILSMLALGDPFVANYHSGRNRAPAGALMLEILHDIAPDAKLFYGDSRSDLLFYKSREKAIEAGARVIVDDVSFPGLGRYDGTSPLSKRATEIVQGLNIAYITAVGDYTPAEMVGTAAYRGKPRFISTYFNADPLNRTQKYHSFKPINSSVRDETLEIAVDPELGFFEAFLVWDDTWVNGTYDASANTARATFSQPAGTATDDIDLIIVDRATLDVARPLAASANIQNGRNANPVERIVTSDSFNPLSLVIRRKNTSDNRATLMTLVITAGSVEETDYLTHGIPLNNNDARGGVIAVGAVDVLNTKGPSQIDTIPGHSPGPGNQGLNRFVQWNRGSSQKPDLLSWDRVRTVTTTMEPVFDPTRKYFMIEPRNAIKDLVDSVPGGGYYARGSSIAAAHVAGFTALLRQRFPGLQARQILPLYVQDETATASGGLLNSTRIFPEFDAKGYFDAPQYRLLLPTGVYQNALAGNNIPTGSRVVRTSTTFTGGATDWTTGPAAAGVFNAPAFANTENGLVLRSSALNTFGYWYSPLLTLNDASTGLPASALEAGKLYRARVTIGSNISDPAKVPDFRIRLMSRFTDEVAELVVNGRTAANTPTSAAGREYSLYYSPSAAVAGDGVSLAVDLLNFHEADAAAAELNVRSVVLEEVQAPAAGTATALDLGAFTGGSAGSGAAFDEPSFTISPDRATIRAVSTNTFGFLQSAPVSLKADRLYRIRVSVTTDVAAPTQVPDFRIRALTTLSDEAAELVVNGRNANSANTPNTGTSTEYTLYYQPSAEVASQGITVSLDLINFNATDAATGALSITAASVEELAVPTASN